uniref:Uncharacterized protein n=1 Tax=Peronospora matthiolae TaxID=2874970 RepID=A0AAV1U8I6_9STRA
MVVAPAWAHRGKERDLDKKRRPLRASRRRVALLVARVLPDPPAPPACNARERASDVGQITRVRRRRPGSGLWWHKQAARNGWRRRSKWAELSHRRGVG